MTQSKDTFTFNGFEPANTTPVPDVLFDELLSWLTGSELKVLLYIIRRTRGFKKDSDAISLSQFQKGITTKEGKQLDKGCGIDDRQTIINALASLEEKKCIVSEKGKTAKGDNATTVYRIFFNQEVVGKTYHRSREKDTTLVGNSNHRSGKKATTVVGNSNPQETVIQDTDKQQTDLQERESTASESDTPVSPPVVGDSRAEYPLITFADCLAYLEQQDVTPRGDAVEQMVQARTLYAHKHPRYEYRARPGLSEHPDDQLPGDTHSQQGDAYGQSDSDHRNHQLPGRDHFPVSHFVVSTEIEQTTPTPTPAQSIPPEPEQAAPGQSAQQNHSAGTPNGAAVGDVPLSGGIAQGAASPKQEPKPLAEPDMSGKWSHEKCVEYAEWCNKKRYTDKMREEQIKAAQAIHKNDGALTLEQYKQAYDERNDAWWQEHKGKLHVNDMKAKGASGIDRVHEMLQRIEDAASRSKPRQISAVPRVKVFSSYDDPNFRSDQDFYPVEGGSYATAVV